MTDDYEEEEDSDGDDDEEEDEEGEDEEEEEGDDEEEAPAAAEPGECVVSESEVGGVCGERCASWRVSARVGAGCAFIYRSLYNTRHTTITLLFCRALSHSLPALIRSPGRALTSSEWLGAEGAYTPRRHT